MSKNLPACTLLTLLFCTALIGQNSVNAKSTDKETALTVSNVVAKPKLDSKLKLQSVQVAPASVVLEGKWSSQSLTALGTFADDTTRDVTDRAEFRSANPKVATVSKEGVIQPVSEGETTILISAKAGGSAKAEVRVAVKGMTNETVFFTRDVTPLLGRLGCAATACHGAQRGRAGFKLSLFGGELGEDHLALTHAAIGRRINKIEPAKSLLLGMATGALPHTGGKRLTPGSAEYNLLVAWINQGARLGDDTAPRFVALKLSADELVFRMGETRRLLVTGMLKGGAQRDCTRLATYKSTDPKVAMVDANGEVWAVGPGECTVVAMAARQATAVRVLVPQILPQPFPAAAANNKVDELVLAKLKRLGIPPSEVCSDQEFCRRIYLDMLGTLPSPAEVKAFLVDKDAQKRGKLIEALFQREEFADYWAMKWGDLLRIKSEYPVRIWPKGVTTYYHWLRESVATNQPYDQFVRELLTTSGSNFRRGPANFVRAVSNKDPQTLAETTAMLFMGARVACARCHAHPIENWSVSDNVALGAFFAKVAYKSTTEWKEEIVYFNPKASLRDPRTREIAKPRLLSGEVFELGPDEDPRFKFADWLISTNNPWFNQAIANRVWFWMMGRGIIHEPDDIRPTNLPENPELLTYLVRELATHKYDLRHLFRLILNSNTYQRSSKANEFNKNDVAHFSHFQIKRLGAEELVDALCQVTEVPETYTSSIPEPYTRLPSDYRAVQVFDGNIQTGVLELFGRPPRDTPYECERDSAPSLRQKLFMINSDLLEGKVTGSPRIQRLIKEKKTDAEIVDEFYLSIVARPPTDQEKQKALAHLAKDPKNRPQAVQDLVWVLLNTQEFMFVR